MAGANVDGELQNAPDGLSRDAPDAVAGAAIRRGRIPDGPGECEVLRSPSHAMKFILTIDESAFLNERAWRTWEAVLASAIFTYALGDAVTDAARAVLPADFPDFSVRVESYEGAVERPGADRPARA
jgi:hypothetical protein